MKEFIKKEEPIFEEEDAHVLGDDEPDGDLPELPKIAARQRKSKIVRKQGRKTKRKTRKSKTGATKRRKGTKRRRKTTSKSLDKGESIGRVKRYGREKEQKLHIRQNDDVIVVDEVPSADKVPTPPPAPAKPTPSNILDQILFAQEKVLAPTDTARKSFTKNKILPNERRSVW
ncbi:uncharacterized protein CELE_R04E5.9 [Caenorhabditis elegans]|uniref:Uncharacterized protein n=1 Tax=Caenorhabditis elegans TaxID=6239 RepID=Q9GYL3_CAEEL|nr:Uncharacterized protein CELE_R04E5.9 [Caenorhabditis elegans]CCD65960.1 Uncharacterized protein CELE_R04E5.9 [Caenorhabditis elegans]|eukprot:NP_509492.2 Uncharacterized protein CELE_R04E5.9 [Caenorhabditis elegans]